VVTVLLVTSLLASTASVASASTDVAITNVTTSVDHPAPDEQFTLGVTVANLQSSSGAADVTAIYVRKHSSTEEYSRTENVGSIAPGGSLEVPLSVSLSSLGYHRLTVHVVVRDGNGSYRRLTHPLYVNVREPSDSLVSVSTPDAIAGVQQTTNVTVASTGSTAISNVQLTLGGNASVKNPERIVATLASGAERTFGYQVTYPDAGPHVLNTTLTYQTADGTVRTARRETTVDVQAANLDVGLTASVGGGNGTGITARLTEFGNVPLTDVQVRAVQNGQTVARELAGDVAAKSSRRVHFERSQLASGNLTIVAQYTAGGHRRSSRTGLEYAPVPLADLTLTSVDVSRSGGLVTLSGDIDNLGSATANSVLVEVASGDGVTSGGSKQTYFVGPVQSSEFSTFELTAAVSGDVHAVPVRIRYAVNGQQRTTVQSVPIDAAGASNGQSGAVSNSDASNRRGPAGSGLPVLPLVGLVVVVLVVAGGIYWWRRR